MSRGVTLLYLLDANHSGVLIQEIRKEEIHAMVLFSCFVAV